jgi:hypothetical protein
MYAVQCVTTQTIDLQSFGPLLLSFLSVILPHTFDRTCRATCLVCPGTLCGSLREDSPGMETTDCRHRTCSLRFFFLLRFCVLMSVARSFMETEMF